MASRASMLMILGVSTVAAAGAMYFVPEVSASADEVHTSVVVARPATQAAVIQTVAVQTPAADDANCSTQAWPYLSAACDTDGSARAARSRQVRVISMDRDAPRAVPLPASVVASMQATAIATQASDIVTVLPPARPASLDGVQTAEAAGATNTDVDVTGSVKPAPTVTAPVRRRVARASAPVVRSDDGDFTPLQVATYRDAYGRDVVVRTAPSQGRRQVFADDGMDRLPRYDRPARDSSPLGWLSQF